MASSDIILDRESFKALASDTRITLLKLLAERKHTLAELSSRLGMSHPSVKDHMDSLVRAGLVERFDEGRKWKYYGLTKKGKGILFPEQRTILVLLAVSVLSAGVFVARWFQWFSQSTYSSFGNSIMAQDSSKALVSEASPQALEAMRGSLSVVNQSLNESASNSLAEAVQSGSVDWVLVVVGVLFVVSVMGMMWLWWRSRKER